MALGGGLWVTQNKTLPGYYANFTSTARASSNLSERGVAAVPLELDWGPVGTVFTVTNLDFQKNAQKIFGYPNDSEKLLPIRELFKNANKLYIYRLAKDAQAASNNYAVAKHPGSRGNDITIILSKSIDDNTYFDVKTYLDSTLVDKQTVNTTANLKDNDFVKFKVGIPLVETSIKLSEGHNGVALTGAVYQDFLDKIESYNFQALTCPAQTAEVIATFIAFTKRMRDEVGAKFKTVVYKTAADYEGVINVENTATENKYGLVYWVAGAEAGCAVNKSNTNKQYDGELTVNVDYTQAELEAGIKAGKFMFHNVNGEIRVLEDINSLTTISDEKGVDFQSNQTLRICDQIANDVAAMFATRYLGVVPNDSSGRISLWNDICKLFQELENIRAIEDFDTNSVVIESGDDKKAVVCNISSLNVINAMSQLYMSVVVA